MRQRVRHREHNAALLARELVQQFDDLTLRARIETGSYFIAEQNFRIADQLHCEAESTLLSAGKNFHGTISDGCQSCFFKGAINACIEIGRASGAHAQARGGLDRFIDGQRIIGNGKLGHVADF